MLNPFFLQGSKGEQGLVQDLINEQLKIYGIDIYYLPRRYVTEKTVMKEVVESEFKNAYPIEAYVDNFDGYGGQGTILSKFGIQELDELTLIISKERYENYIAPLSKDIPNVKLTSRPKEGDLIYFPLGDRIFEIKYVEHEKPFYQLQKNYVYELRCELFRYQDEDIDTDIDFIDDNTADIGYIQTLQMVGVGETALAVTNIVNGGVYKVEVTNRGRDYTDTPRVAISSAPIGGFGATGIATMIGGIFDPCTLNSSSLRVQGVELTNSGYGYTVAPKVAFFDGGGSGAEAISYIGDGVIGIVTITNGGGGYVNPPTVSFIGISSVSAEGYAVVSAAGTISRVAIINAGYGYTEPPQIIIADPPSFIGMGTYIYNEIVTGSESGVTGRVKSWNSITNILEVANITGSFANGELLVGEESNASYLLRVLNTDNLSDSEDLDNKSGQFESNDEIQIEANKILDFTESNPFGTP
jgi:hypothetical protein